MKIGILAYGSLIDDPGIEIEKLLIEKRDGILTPFHVEFAHASIGRGGAPTLVPVENGGSQVNAKLLVLKENTTLEHARNILYRREIGTLDTNKQYKEPTNKNIKGRIYVEHLEDVFGMDLVLYTKIEADIILLTPDNLAGLAIKSAKKGAGKEKKDGISYLINAKKNGIHTALNNEYEQEILKQMKTSNLEEAWRKCVN